ncbi:DUF3558 domain-containing protein [Nocardia niwae]|uniref:DUF3558 domain-containing protein n=1 Tax=Nocardia niwae TaxID=626084 RepID=A0ABV2XHP2_9NOCA
MEPDGLCVRHRLQGRLDGPDREASVGRRTTATVAALAGVVLAASGCESGTNGTATPSTTIDTSAATAALWDPCTQVSDQVLQKIGVSPSTRESGVSGVEEPGWKHCNWSSADFALGVWSTIHSVDDFRRKEGNIEFTDISVGGRGGVQYRRAKDKHDEDCDLVFPASRGSLSITIYNHASSKNVIAPCTRAMTAAETLVPIFPR